MNTFFKKSDSWLALMVVGLVVIGILMIYSASVVLAHTRFGDDMFFMKKQIVAGMLGLVGMIIMACIDYHYWQRWAGWMLVVTFILLISVFFFSAGEINGAHRWIKIGGQSFQPSELAKLTFSIYIAAWLAQRRDQLHSFRKTFLPYILVLAAVSVLVLMQPDFGTLSIILVPAVAMYYVAGIGWKQVAAGIGIGALAVVLILAAAPYRLERIKTFLNPTEDTSGRDYHVKNISIAVGSGGLWGVGFGESKQKRLFLPEPHTDSIFAVIAEEMGMVRSMLLIALLAAIALRGYRIAAHAPDDFGRYLAVGITSWFGYQTFLNLASMLHVVPLVGVPLPFVSYGGTSLLISLAAAGLLLSISREGKPPTDNPAPKRSVRGHSR